MRKHIILTFISISVLAACLPRHLSTTTPDTNSQITSSTSLLPTATIQPSPTATQEPRITIDDADTALFIGDYQTALSLYQKTYDQSHDNETQSAALMGLGRTYIALSDFNSALTIFNQVLNQYPNSIYTAAANYYLGISYDALKNYGMAAASYASYITSNPGVINADIYELEGDALSNNSDLTGAINAYTAALQSNPPGDLDSLNLKIGRAYLALQQYDNAVRIFMTLYDATQSDYTKATTNLLAGQAYNQLGYPEQAYARYQDSVSRFPRSYDSYSQLVTLVNDNQPVDDLDRGVVDYYAGQYGYAIDALVRYINSTTEHEGSAHFYLALSYRATDQLDAALTEFDALIRDHPSDRFWASAWDEKSYTLWYNKEQYREGAQVLLDFVSRVPSAVEAPAYLFEAGRIFERGNFLFEAATTWERLINEYPSAEQSYRGLFLSGITYYRMANYDYALTIFQRYLVLTSNPEEQSAANFWIGKIHSAKGDTLSASKSWQLANSLDATGYYGIRSKELLQNQSPLPASGNINLDYNLSDDRVTASSWLREKFNIPISTDLDSLTDFASNPVFLRAEAYYSIGQYEKASDEFDALRQQFSVDAINSFRLLGHLIDLRLYEQAILTSRQILDLLYGSDAATLEAPQYFNHIRFGAYYQSLVENAASTNNIDPLLLFSLMRQESLFEGHAASSAGAIGVMQIMPATGQETADLVGWPVGFTTADLYRPSINIPLGTSYLARQRDYFGGDMFAAVAAYNGGAGNVQIWMSLANNDPDLFIEIIRFDETQNYVKQIVEFYNIYRMIYSKP
jgi:soluble lytic murein transglycosylase